MRVILLSNLIEEYSKNYYECFKYLTPLNINFEILSNNIVYYTDNKKTMGIFKYNLFCILKISNVKDFENASCIFSNLTINILKLLKNNNNNLITIPLIYLFELFNNCKNNRKNTNIPMIFTTIEIKKLNFSLDYQYFSGNAIIRQDNFSQKNQIYNVTDTFVDNTENIEMYDIINCISTNFNQNAKIKITQKNWELIYLISNS